MANQLNPQLKLIRELIEFPTVSRDSNLELINFISHYLESHGIESKLVHSDCGNKANLVATIGPNIGGGIVLSGHTDVVPWMDRIGTATRFVWIREKVDCTVEGPQI